MTTEIKFIHLLRGWFLTPFCLFFLYAAPTRKCARASHEMAQFMLKIAHLAILMEPTRLLEKVSSYGLLPRIWLLICSKTYCTIRHYLLCLLIISTSEPRAPMQNGLSFTYTPLLWGRCFLLTLMTGARSRLLVIGSCWRWIILQSMSACHWLKVKQDHLCLLGVESQITVRWPGAWKDD